MDKKDFIRQQISTLTQSFFGIVLSVGILVILSLSVVDYFVTPENFFKFLIYRIITSSLILLFYFLNRTTKKEVFQFILMLVATLIVAGMAELMIFSLGGHQSPYYAGMILLLLYVGIVPLSFWPWLLVPLSVYLTYFLPIIFFDEITNWPIFIHNNIVLILSLGTVIMWRYLDYKLLIKKLSLEYELWQEKEKLVFYSKNLEKLIQEKTAELEEEKTALEIRVRARTRELEEEKASLGEKVKERTKELQGKIEDLEKFHRLAVGRELKMVELKEEIKKLKEELKKLK